MREEFDPDALHRLIDEALGEVDPPSTLPTASRLPFTYGETHLLEYLAEVLPKYLHGADLQMVLEELRLKYLHGASDVKLQHLHTVVRHCRRCPEVEPSPQLPTWNVNNPDVAFVAENMVQKEEAGRYFVKALKQSGFSSRHVVLTAVTRCPIAGRGPNHLEVENCSSYLYSELQVMAPKLIIPLGNTAAGTFIGTAKITEDHGRIFWLGPWAVMPTFSPAYVLTRDLQEPFESDLKKAHGFVYGASS